MQPVPVRVRDAIDPIIVDNGLSLLGIELGREGHRTILWVFVDTDDGATIQDCARVTPEISATLDVADPVHESYELRVSTPGVDRPLMKADHFVECVGEEIQLVLMSPLGGRRKFTGINQGLNGENVVIECSDG
jgi:ribosome maturation factor RimP